LAAAAAVGSCHFERSRETMKTIFSIFFSLAFISCAQTHKQENKPALINTVKFQGGKTYTVSCDADKSNSYSLYLPQQYDSAKTFPVIYFFDPHGKGNFPLEKYKSLADELGIIFAGSNNTKNGMDWQEINQAALLLFSDTKQKLNIDATKIFTCGFSGGGRIAANLATINKTIAGVISCSAGLPANPSQIRKDMIFVGIAGKEDMNLSEIFDAAEALRNTEIKYLVKYFDGPHEWCPLETMKEAMQFCLAPTPSKTENTIDKKIIEREKQQKNFYSEAFTKNDFAWWNNEFQKLEQKIANKNSPDAERYMYIRLKNFLSLAAFSYSNSALNSSRLPEADKFLSIYKLVDAKNSEHAYLRAKYFMLKNNAEEAGKALTDAAVLGFDDKERLQAEQLFITLQNTVGYKKIMGDE